jgi:outer membrane protein TolC
MSFRLSASILCIALAGCSVGPEYARPDAPVPAAFGERADAGAAWPSLAKVAGAALLPSVNAGGAAVHERVLATSGSYQTVNLYGAQLSASCEIDFWGRNRAIRDAAAAAANASRYDRATVELIVMGVGLGLSLVCAVAKLHVGSLELADNHPGLRARMVLSSAA